MAKGPPIGGGLIIGRNGDQLRVVTPASAIGAADFLMLMAIIVCVAPATVASVFLGSAVLGGWPPSLLAVAFAGLTVMLLFTPALLVTLLLLNHRLARQELTVTRSTVTFFSVGVILRRRRIWPAEVVAGLVVDKLGCEPPALALVLASGRRFTLLSRPAAAHLEWCASEANGMLGKSLDPSGQPAWGRAVVKTYSDGVTVYVPPSGLHHNWAGNFRAWLVCCAIIGGGFMAVSLCAHAGALVLVIVNTGPGCLALTGFLLALYYGRQRALLAIVGDRLLVLREWPLASRRAEWCRDDIARLRAFRWPEQWPPVWELQIESRSGRRFRMLGGHDPHELVWLAGMLQDALHLSDGDV